MKNKYKTMAIIVVTLALGIWGLYEAPFNEELNGKISANVYKDGVITSDTTVAMYGQKSNYLFHDDNRFEGKFIIPSYEITYGGTAIINRMDNTNMHNLFYAQLEPFAEQEIHAPLLINEYMSEFALMIIDGTVIATSDELYAIFIKHVHADAGGTTIRHIDEIPRIE